MSAQVFTILALLFALTSVLAGLALTVLWRRARAEATTLRARFGPVVDLDAECERLRAERDRTTGEIQAMQAAVTQARSSLKAEVERERADLSKDLADRRSRFEKKYAAALEDLDRLTREVKLYDERADLQSFGLYQPFYDFGTAEEYKRELEAVRARQAATLKAGMAAVCPREWTVDGDRKKGRQMTERNLKLMLRAFNGESDAAISRVRFNNAVAIEERIRKVFEAVNKLGEPNACSIQRPYLDLKLAELRLTHEYAEKVQAEKEEQREIRERMREEEAAQRDFERAQREAEKEEQRYTQALERARQQLDATVGTRHREMEAKVLELEAKLAAAHAMKERAISQAQLTRSGHVYVISNVGSFGESVFKVGMTRRLEPEERVRELGDASVPFAFDIHAVIYSEDAPRLENALHRALASKRLNLVNPRKEFFSTTLEEIESLARQNTAGEFAFMRTAVAEEYRKSLAMREAAEGSLPDVVPPLVSDERSRFESVRAELAEA